MDHFSSLPLPNSLLPFLLGVLAPQEDPDMKYLAQRALISYLRGVHRMGMAKPEIFDVTKIDAPALAASMGLPQPPKLKFVKRAKKQSEAAAAKLAQSKLKNLPYEEQEKLAGRTARKKKGSKDEEPLTQAQRLLRRQNQTVLSESRTQLNVFSDDSDDPEEDEEDFLVVKRRDHDLDLEDGFTEKEAEIMRRRELNARKHEMTEKEKAIEDLKQSELFDPKNVDRDFLDRAKKRLEEADIHDKAAHRQRVREKKLQRKIQQRQMEQAMAAEVREKQCCLSCLLVLRGLFGCPCSHVFLIFCLTGGQMYDDGGEDEEEEFYSSDEGEDDDEHSTSSGTEDDAEEESDGSSGDEDLEDDAPKAKKVKRSHRTPEKPSISDLETQALSLLGVGN